MKTIKLLIMVTIFVSLTNTYAQETGSPSNENIKHGQLPTAKPEMKDLIIQPTTTKYYHYKQLTYDYKLQRYNPYYSNHLKSNLEKLMSMKKTSPHIACISSSYEGGKYNEDTVHCCDMITYVSLITKKLLSDYNSITQWDNIKERLSATIPELNRLSCQEKIPLDYFVATQNAVFGESEVTKSTLSGFNEACVQSLSNITAAKSDLIDWHLENSEPNHDRFSAYKDSIIIARQHCEIKFKLKKK